MTAKEYLSRARELDREIDRKIDRLGDLYAAVTKRTSQLSQIPGSGQNDRAFEERMEKYLLLRDEINADIDVLADLKKEICASIDALPNEKHRTILEKYYIQRMTCREIGDELGYELHHVAKLKKEALDLLKIPKIDKQ